MNVYKFLMLCIVACLANTAFAESQVIEIKSKNTVALLAATKVIYDASSDNSSLGFHLRMLQYIGDGECTENVPCDKNKIIFVTSSFDEYPDRRAFVVPLHGEYQRINVVSAPTKENGAYVLRVLYESYEGKESCTEYKVQLGRIVSIACKSRESDSIEK